MSFLFRLTTVLFLLIATHCLAAPPTNSYQDFWFALKKAVAETNRQTIAAQENRKSLGVLEPVEKGVKGSRGTWDLTLIGYSKVSRKVSENGVLATQGTAELANYPDHFAFILLFPEGDSRFLNSIERKLAPLQQETAKKIPEATFTFSRQGKQLLMSVTYTYTAEPTQEQTRKQLERLIASSRKLLSEFAQHSLVAAEERERELPYEKITALNREELAILLKKSDLEMKEESVAPPVAEGHFVFSYKKQNYYLQNHGGKIVVAVITQLLPAENSTWPTTVTALEAWVSGNKAPSASSMRLVDRPPATEEAPREVAIEAEFLLDGSLTGEKLANAIVQFVRKYAPPAQKEIRKIASIH